jgi:hypothetical protein
MASRTGAGDEGVNRLRVTYYQLCVLVTLLKCPTKKET